MKTQSFQHKLDNIIEKLFLWAFPKEFKPNWLSLFRIGTVPVIFWLLIKEYSLWAFTLFIISACSDFIDGTMARKRNQITDMGKILDPIADKLLIATVLIFIGFEYLVVRIFLVFILLEIVAVLTSSVLAYKIGRPLGANFYGKVKMVLQSFSVALFLLGLITKNNSLIITSEYILGVALFFAILAGIEVFRLKYPVLKKSFLELLKSI